MKKIKFLFLSLLLVAALVSCDKSKTDKNMFGSLSPYGASAFATEGPSKPISLGADGIQFSPDDVIPQIIPGANNGGNRTCAEVGTAFMKNADYFALCGNKIDYNGSSFDGEFPEGLDVTVTGGKYVAFELDGCIEIEGKFYKVGAVIVKGSAAANVYYYPGGTLRDAGLAPPVNASGNPAGLSNLTFCFIQCEPQEPEELVVAYKAYSTPYVIGETSYVTSGAYITSYPLVVGRSYLLYYRGVESEANEVGYLTVTEDADGHLEVTVDNTLNPDIHFTKSHLYVGTSDDLPEKFTEYTYIETHSPPVDTWTKVLP